jgi:hypothetical protein
LSKGVRSGLDVEHRRIMEGVDAFDLYQVLPHLNKPIYAEALEL